METENCRGESKNKISTTGKSSLPCGAESDSGTQNFHISVGKVSGNCKAGEDWSVDAIKKNKIPVLSCEGPCIKGEIARRAAGILPGQDSRFKRACHGETFYVPYSSMAKWVKSSSTVIMIDGCFLSCHGRVLKNIVKSKKILHINAHSIHKKHGNDFAIGEILDTDLNELASQVVETIRAKMPIALH